MTLFCLVIKNCIHFKEMLEIDLYSVRDNNSGAIFKE